MTLGGNYLLNWDDARWAPLSPLFDEKWFICCESESIQRTRLIKRHLETWTPEKERLFGQGVAGAAKKTDSNDFLNMQLISENRKFV